jgi:AraC family ethanolamine operon transcriptional activator
MTDFCDIDSLNEMAATSGWDCLYQQMRPGRLAARSTFRQVGQSFLLREQVSHSVQFRGAPSSNHVAFMLVSQHEGARIAGTDPGTADLWFVPPGYDLSMISGGVVDICTISIPRSALRSNQTQASADRALVRQSAPRPLPLSDQDRLSLASRLGACFAAPSDDAMLTVLERVLVDTLCDLLGQRNSTPGLLRDRQYIRHKRLLKVIDHLNAHHHRRVSVPEMASIAGLTDRTLRRYFREHFGLSPLQYDRTRRLNCARRLLASGSMSTGTVTEAALNTGFEQLGRFSRDFRGLFGMSPSAFVAEHASNRISAGRPRVSHNERHCL